MSSIPNGNKEDFTLLNLSNDSSSLSSEELYRDAVRQVLPNVKKKRLRVKRRSSRPGSNSTSQSPNHHTPSQFSRGHFISSQVIYAFLLILLCWLGTLSWLLFSLKDQSTEAWDHYQKVAALASAIPISLTSLNSTFITMQLNVTELAEELGHVQTQLNELAKALKAYNGETELVKQNLATLGSTVSQLKDQLDDMAKGDSRGKVMDELGQLKKKVDLLTNGNGGDGGNKAEKSTRDSSS